MAYSAAWSEAIPAGSLSAADIDQAIRDAKRDIRERVAGVFGMADWSADPLVAVSMAFGALPAQSGVVRVENNVGAVVARNSANNADIVLSKLNAADVLELAGAKVKINPATGTISFAGAQKILVTTGTTLDFRKGDDSTSILLLDEATSNVQVSNGVLNALVGGVRTIIAAPAGLPAGAAAKDGLVGIDSTNNRLCYWSNGTRYFIATGTIF